MSRSYRKTPIITNYWPGRKQHKRWANKAVRRLPVDFEIPNGSRYKVLYESYKIKDYAFIIPDKGTCSWDVNIMHNPLYVLTWIGRRLQQTMSDSLYRQYYIK